MVAPLSIMDFATLVEKAKVMEKMKHISCYVIMTG